MKILQLPRPFHTPLNIELPSFDVHGGWHGDSYEPILEARTVRYSTRTTAPSLLFGRACELLSEHERRVYLALVFSPYVVDVREQYPMVDDAIFWKERNAGKRIRKVDMPSLDFVASYIEPNAFRLCNHAISVKPTEAERDLPREARDQVFTGSLSWSYESLLGSEVPDVMATNYFLLYTWLRESILRHYHEKAGSFSKTLRQAARGNNLGSLLRRLSARCGISEDEAQRYFAASIRYGYLELNHELPLSLHRRLHLQTDG